MSTSNTALERPASIMGAGWQRYVFPAIWLVYLAQTVSGVHKHSTGAASVVGYTIVVAFGAVYMAAMPAGWHNWRRWFWTLYVVLVLLTVAEAFFADQDAFVFCVYITVLTIASQVSWRFIGIAVLALATTYVPMAVPPWHHASPDYNGGLTVVLVAFAMYGFFHIILSNRELSAARAEVARLAAEAERSRIARDLHDLLGHSLTAITVKAGLARRLAERGDDRAGSEIREVEQLARRTLGDVRAAVAGHNEVTLAGELATAGEVLRAAGVVAELPGSVDVVEPRFQEVFGWVVREGVTNLVRHAHAPTCRITIGARWIEVADTGSGGTPGCGSGLRGLRERVDAIGGVLSATGGFSGFKLRVEVPADAEPAEALDVHRTPAPGAAPVDDTMPTVDDTAAPVEATAPTVDDPVPTVDAGAVAPAGRIDR